MSNLERGREAYERQAWADARQSLSLADRATPLSGEDLDRLAVSSALSGHEEEFLATLERAHHAHLEADQPVRAIRSAFWLGFRLINRGEVGRATGWFARAGRLLESVEPDCVERGYLLLPTVRQQLAAGDSDAAFSTADTAAAIGDRFGDADLVAFTRNLQGRVRLRQGRLEEGLALLDEAMVAVTAGEISPILTGVIYCSVIDCCRQVYALDRVREWTSALSRWCEEKEVVAFSGHCLVHRAEIMQLNGAWPDALVEARRASKRLAEGTDHAGAAEAFYQQAEVHRLRGEFAEAEEAYRSASRWGWDPQPGLALLRMAQGHADTASTQMRRVMGATTDRLQRTRLLPAFVEILLASGDLDGARGAARELEEIAKTFDSDVVNAMALHARGSVELAGGNAQEALGPLRRSFELWQGAGAPYIAARLRVLVGQACRALGDADGAGLELDGARAVFEELGAAPDLARLDAPVKGAAAPRPHGLTPRELEVLLLVAAGKTNKAIAAELFLSEKTVDRHLSNIFAKLDVASRTAAAAFAYENKLI